MAQIENPDTPNRSSSVESTIDILISSLKDMAGQITGDIDYVSFIQTVKKFAPKCNTLEDLINLLFGTKDYNGEWVKVFKGAAEKKQGGSGESEFKNGPRYRMSVGFLAAWHKALRRFYSDQTDVTRVFGGQMSRISLGLLSLNASKARMGDTQEDKKK